MVWMNRHEVEEAMVVALQHRDEQPNRFDAAFTLVRLVNLTDRMSDGWPYWSKPAKAASRLMELLTGSHAWWVEPTEIDGAALRKAYTPIKRFLTVHGVPHEEVFG